MTTPNKMQNTLYDFFKFLFFFRMKEGVFLEFCLFMIVIMMTILHRISLEHVDSFTFQVDVLWIFNKYFLRFLRLFNVKFVNGKFLEQKISKSSLTFQHEGTWSSLTFEKEVPWLSNRKFLDFPTWSSLKFVISCSHIWSCV